MKALIISCIYQLISTYLSISIIASTYMKNSRSRPQNPRKRRQESPAPYAEQSGTLLLTNPETIQTTDNVVDEAKVKTYLNKLSISEEAGSTCIKILVCNSEAQLLAPQIDAIQADFEAATIAISDSAPLSVDRIVTIYGTLKQALCVALYVSFLLTSDFNNVVKNEAYTLKSLNYKLDVLVEGHELALRKLESTFPSIEYALYDQNPKLWLVSLRGDFSSLIKYLAYIALNFPFDRYVADSNIEHLSVIGVHDGDYLYQRQDENVDILANNTKNVLQHIFTKAYLEEVN